MDSVVDSINIKSKSQNSRVCMKNKHKGPKVEKNSIKEIDVGSLVKKLASIGPQSPVGVVGTDAKATFQRLPTGDKLASNLPAPSHQSPGNSAFTRASVQPSVLVPVSSSLSGDTSNVLDFSGQVGRAKKQRMRLLRKLQDRSAGLPADGVSVSGTEESSEPQSPDERSNRPPKQRKNYVHRNSSLTGGTTPSKCSWKDFACVFLVLVVIFAAGFLRMQEEIFGSVDHLRQESDADADYYEILGIPHAASARDIKKAYRDKVLEVHPDHHPNCGDCEQRFISSTKAYETLVDVDKRKVYDQNRGSYEPILSDFSVSLTSFNYKKLVADSPSVWVIQVYDDLDSYSKYFAQQWDIVAGSELAEIGIRFGRVNARRDRAVLSFLPIRSRTYPTVMLFTRDTMPAIFSLADTSSKALRKWIIAETPDTLDQARSGNAYKLVLKMKGTVPLRFKSVSVAYSRIFDFELAQATTSDFSIDLMDKKTGAMLQSTPCIEKNIFQCVESFKQRLLVPVNRYNLYDVCDNHVNPVRCVFDTMDFQVLAPIAQFEDDDVLLQRISLKAPKSFILDLTGSMISYNVNNGFDPSYSPIDRNAFADSILPRSLFDTLSDHSTLLTICGLLLGVGVVLSRFGAVHITVAVLGMSILVGVLNSPTILSTLSSVKEVLRGYFR